VSRRSARLNRCISPCINADRIYLDSSIQVYQTNVGTPPKFPTFVISFDLQILQTLWCNMKASKEPIRFCALFSSAECIELKDKTLSIQGLRYGRVETDCLGAA
jgi:hypothetical protein